MLLNYKKIVLMSHRLAAFHSLWQWGLNLDLIGIEGVIIHLSVTKIMVLTLFSMIIFTGRPSFMGARGASWV